MMKFVRLLHRDMDKLAEALSPRARQDHPRRQGRRAARPRSGRILHRRAAPAEGRVHRQRGPGIDMYSMRQPLGVVAGITPFNFPAMIPMWMFCPGHRLRQRLHPEAVRARPVGAADAGRTDEEAGLPEGVLQVVNGDKEAVDAILDIRTIIGIGFVGSTPIAQYIYSRGCANGKRVQCFGGAKNHMIVMPDADMDQAADALIGAGYGAAGERCMAISVAVPVGEETADR
jgi:malonate-semialdehyde dehydrogenase (acetylating)/methylmalonate-semialdehyde dehydrogenase